MSRRVIAFNLEFLEVPPFLDSEITKCLDGVKSSCASMSIDDRRAMLCSIIEVAELKRISVASKQNSDKDFQAMVDIAISPMPNIRMEEKLVQEISCSGVFVPWDQLKDAIAYLEKKHFMLDRKLQIISELQERTTTAADLVPSGTDEVVVPMEDSAFRAANWSEIHSELASIRHVLSDSCGMRIEIPPSVCQCEGDLYRAALVAIMAGISTIQLTTNEMDDDELRATLIVFRAARDCLFIFNRPIRIMLYNADWNSHKAILGYKLCEVVINNGNPKEMLGFTGPNLLLNVLSTLEEEPL